MRSRHPQKVDNVTWYYEEKTFLEVVHEIRGASNEYYRTDHIKLPIIKIKRSLERYGYKIVKED